MNRSDARAPFNLDPTGEVRLSLESSRFLIPPGVRTKIPISVANLGSQEDVLSLSIQDLPADWAFIAPDPIYLSAGENRTVEAHLQPPRRAQANPTAISLTLQAASEWGAAYEERLDVLVGVSSISENIGVLTGTNQIAGSPGERQSVPIYLINRGASSDHISLAIDGLPEGWLTVVDAKLRLAPGERRKISLSLQIPRDDRSRPGRHPFTLEVSSENRPEQPVRLDFTLTVAVFVDFECMIEPACVRVGQPVAITVGNKGNIPQLYSLSPQAPGRELVFSPDAPVRLQVLPGELVTSQFKIKPHMQHWFGKEREIPFRLQVSASSNESHTLSGSFVSRARFPFISLRGDFEQPTRARRWYRRVNWPMVLGSLLVSLMLLLAVVGPRLARQDPMKENYTFAVNGQIVKPPYPPFSVPGYPLGTDQYGRDLLSRILWGMRPTMILVVTVALVRLVLGNLFGLWIGWSDGWSARILGGFLSIALSIPVLIVSLMGITAVGIQRGLWAFIAGLALTGWAETARLVSTQTRIIRGQLYVEAARSQGASDFSLLANHVFRQIAPLLGMLLAFEISATLFVVAELGFLGYYIGGGIWVEVSDFVAVNVAGLPELGQMLSTALISLVNPTILLVVGSVVFFNILGFNLMGEGLRSRLSQQAITGRRRWVPLGEKFQSKFGNRYPRYLSDWFESNAVVAATCVAILLIVMGWTGWQVSRPKQTAIVAQQRLEIPGGHLWASERHDAQGTRWTPATGPDSSTVAWTYQAPSGYTGGPAIAADGTIILTTRDKGLIALTASGKELWWVPIPDTPVGTPALGKDGSIYVATEPGGLAAYTSDGKPLWYFVRGDSREATSGPIVAADGSIFYTQVDRVQAVKPGGTQSWNSYASDVYVSSPPALSAGESYLFLKDTALAANSGARLALEGLSIETQQFSNPVFFVGADSKTYLRTGHAVVGWKVTQTGVAKEPPISWNYQSVSTSTFPPIDQGVTPGGLVWMFYGGDYNDSRLIWIDQSGRLIGNTRIPERQSMMIAIDEQSVAYICSNNYGQSVNCQAIATGKNAPLWTAELGDGMQVVGGALISERLYVATDQGLLFAIGPGNP